MAVSQAERRSYDDRIRQTREEAEEREASLVKRKNAELKRLEQRHQAELKKINEEYQNQLDSVQSRNRETLTERDRKHREDMDEMKGVYLGQLRRKMEDNQQQREVLEETYRNELAKQKSVSSAQRDHISQRQSEALAERDERFNELVQSSRKEMNEAIDRNRRQLGEAHEKETSVLRADRDESLARKELEKRELVKAYTGQVKHERRLREGTEGRWHQKYYDTVENMKSAHGEQIEGMRDEMAEAIVHERDKFQRKLEDQYQNSAMQSQNFQDSVENRQNSQIRSRDSQIQNLQAKLNTEKVKNERMRGLERRNLTQAYEKRWDDLERQRRETVDVMKDLADRRVAAARGNGDETIRQMERDRRIQTANDRMRNREDRQQLIEAGKDRQEEVQAAADRRIRQVQKDTNESIRVMSDHYDEKLADVKDTYAERVTKQRDAHVTEQSNLTRDINKRFRDFEIRAGNRLEMVTGEYENKIAQMKENFAKDKRRIEDMYEQRLNALSKGHKVEKDSVEQKYEAKLAVSEERHREDMEKLNRKHQEELKVVAQRVNGYSRKA